MTFASLRSLLLRVGGSGRAEPALRVGVWPLPGIVGPGQQKRQGRNGAGFAGRP